jgi:ABC-type Zn uptake system ZnuABC Zn-binding protein ZnuA
VLHGLFALFEFSHSLGRKKLKNILFFFSLWNYSFPLLSAPKIFSVVVTTPPLEFIVRALVKERGNVFPLFPQRTCVHHVNLAPGDLLALDKADLIIFEDTFSPKLSKKYPPTKRLMIRASSKSQEADHVWSDPHAMIQYAEQVTRKLIQVDPTYADVYTKNNKALKRDLLALDRHVRERLGPCREGGASFAVLDSAYKQFMDRYHLPAQLIFSLASQSGLKASHLLALKRFLTQNPGACVIIGGESSSTSNLMQIIQRYGGKPLVFRHTWTHAEDGNGGYKDAILKLADLFLTFCVKK